MLFEHRYTKFSGVRQDDAATAMSFAPDTLRPPTYFRGRIAKQIEFREAISALHDVVTSDLRFIPKDRSDYLAWRERQSYIDLAQITRDQQRIAGEIQTLQTELSELEARGTQRRRDFYDQRQKYFSYLYERDKELWFKLDPVITVHPDQVFFECFSKDESSYGRLAASYEVFEELGDRANGTTNIDYSEKLYGEFQKIRSYKTTTLDIDPSGFDVKTSMEDSYREVKIDLPDTWVRGFLQVSSAATLPAHVLELHPMDVHNLCLLLRRNKELFGPRSLRFQLTPGGPVKIVLDPWGTVLDCPRSRYVDSRADGTSEVRIWGRRRLHILERLLPRATKVRVFLLGSGLPSYWVVDLGALSFTLGLSGWTLNNWSDSGNFDLMAAREDVDSVTQQRVFDELGKTWLATPDELAKRTGLATPIVASALAGWVQAGRAIYDLDRGVYRKRELTRDPLPIEKLRYANEREQRAAVLLHTGKIAVDKADTSDGGLVLAGRLADRGRTFAPTITFDVEQRLVGGDCTCDYFIRNRLHRGPCEHMLALRAAHRRGINDPASANNVVSFQPKAEAPREVPSAERENFQAAFRRAVLRAAELRTASRITDAIAELERIARLAPPESDEQRRIQEVIAEAKLEAGQHAGAREAAERALALFPASALALRVKRYALAALGDLASAIPAARHLVTVENTVERWEQLLLLCERQADWAALVGFAEEALRAHPRTPQFVLARDSARAKLPADAEIPPPADDGTARPSWWRRAWRKITGAPPAGDVLELEITKIVEALAERGTVVDRTTLVQTVRLAHAAGDTKDARVQSIGEALQKSAAIRGLPDDKQLLALLRKVVS
jgi:tetratricopeptide (TPR) repeat protein